jgi:hypothetical protein
MSRRRRIPCPTPSKRRYASIDEAREGYERESRMYPYRQVADRAYHCMCGVWHRTKRNDPHLDSEALT